MAMDIRKVKKLIEMLEQSDVAEIEVREGEECVRISKNPPVMVAPPTQQVLAGDAAAATPAPAPVPAPVAADPAPADSGGNAVKSPMVGIFYASSSPESPPYVTVGKRVNKGEVLCIIEAMKVMNHIEAPAAGVVKTVHVNNGEPVEFGEPLFTIE